MDNDRIYYSRETQLHALRDRLKLTALFLTFGLGIGAILALLFAPSSGKKVRDDLAQTVEEGLNAGREVVEPLVKRLEKDFDELRKHVEERLTPA
jgi:gas vesicle protein